MQTNIHKIGANPLRIRIQPLKIATRLDSEKVHPKRDYLILDCCTYAYSLPFEAVKALTATGTMTETLQVLEKRQNILFSDAAFAWLRRYIDDACSSGKIKKLCK